MSQIALPLDWPAGGPHETVLLSASNRAAAHQLDRWATWPVPVMLLVGPRKSGRSLLARTAMARAGGRLIDDAEAVAEDMLFHAWNRAGEERRPLVLVADRAPPAWAPKLADLRSRLAATPVARIADPDDDLVPALIAHLFERRNLLPPSTLVDWLARRVERSHLAILNAVDALDEAALARRARLSVSLARTALPALAGDAPTPTPPPAIPRPR